MKFKVIATIECEYEMSDETALKAYGTLDLHSIVASEKDALENDGDYFISLLSSDVIHESYHVVVSDSNGRAEVLTATINHNEESM